MTFREGPYSDICPGFHFANFWIKHKIHLPILSFDSVIDSRITVPEAISKLPKLIGDFKEYLRIGYYPLFMEYQKPEAIYEALLGVIEKVIYMDIASYFQLKTSSLPILKKILSFVATASPSNLNINRIAQSVQKDHSDVAQYLEMMRSSSLFRFLVSDKRGHAFLRKPEKIYLNNSNLYYVMEKEYGKRAELGSVRELFVLTSLENAGYKCFYSEKGDIACEKYIFEVGGSGKNTKQIKNIKETFLVLDDILFGDQRKIPLYLFGFLY